MTCSPEKLAANRKNCVKSCGPKTAEGKEKSRRNGLKHGLTGAGVVLPDEDQAAIAGRFEAFEADLKPKGAVALAMVLRAAMLSVRMERCVRQEAAKITRDMLRADETEADDRAEEFARLVGSIAENPADSVRKLHRSAEGIDWLIRSWQGLRIPLLDPTFAPWATLHGEIAERLSGQVPAAFGVSKIAALFQSLRRDPRLPLPTDLPGLECKEAARLELIALVEAEIAALERLRNGLDHQAIAADRAGAATRAIFDASPEAVLARRYEAAAERGFYRAIKAVEIINEEAEYDEMIAVKSTEDEDNDELASSFPDELAMSTPRRSRFIHHDDHLSPALDASAEEWSAAREKLREEIRVGLAELGR